MSAETDATIATDPLYEKTCEFVKITGKTRISSVQMEFKIGYNRAARHLEAMEVAGIVSPTDSRGERKLLVPNAALTGGEGVRVEGTAMRKE